MFDLKHLYFFIVTILISQADIIAQSTIEQFFYEIEFETVKTFKKDAKSRLLKNQLMCKFFNTDSVYSDTIPNPKSYTRSNLNCYRIRKFEPKKGYIEFEINTQQSDNGEIYSICYWNISDGSKLVAVRHTELGTLFFDTIHFYLNKDDNITKINPSNVLPNLEFKDLVNIKQLTKDRHDKTEFEKIYKKVIFPYYILPIDGKDIVYGIEIHDGPLSTDKEVKLLKKFQKYYFEKITLRWNDGHFVTDNK